MGQVDADGGADVFAFRPATSHSGIRLDHFDLSLDQAAQAAQARLNSKLEEARRFRVRLFFFFRLLLVPRCGAATGLMDPVLIVVHGIRNRMGKRNRMSFRGNWKNCALPNKNEKEEYVISLET